MVFVVDVNTANIWKGKSKTLKGLLNCLTRLWELRGDITVSK